MGAAAPVSRKPARARGNAARTAVTSQDARPTHCAPHALPVESIPVMPRARPLAAVLLVLAAAAAAAAGPDDPTVLIGMDPPQVFAALGAPGEIFSWRGAVPAEDDVVFFYPDFRYVFWFQSRVWQVRFDHRYVGTVLGYSPGMSRWEAMAAGQGRLQEAGGSLYLTLDGGRYPLRVRLVLSDDRVTDIYLYRSDW